MEWAAVRRADSCGSEGPIDLIGSQCSTDNSHHHPLLEEVAVTEEEERTRVRIGRTNEM